ncbi:unnamed protein product [Pleuronectes platessa]|uniref:Uncharacterized protein n=1 Tax=Pleuronectes platessa TaxID=8262 RepID=A0A9N7VFP3_PLEPL|nr:unnamed protein product [Pleuronectes platessa]
MRDPTRSTRLQTTQPSGSQGHANLSTTISYYGTYGSAGHHTDGRIPSHQVLKHPVMALANVFHGTDSSLCIRCSLLQFPQLPDNLSHALHVVVASCLSWAN